MHVRLSFTQDHKIVEALFKSFTKIHDADGDTETWVANRTGVSDAMCTS
jgi:hypothetical protein